MLTADEVITPVRGFTGTSLQNPDTLLGADAPEVRVAMFLPATVEFILDERAIGTNNDHVISRLREVASVVVDLSIEGGTDEQRTLLEEEMNKPGDENVFALAVDELATIARDFRNERRGSVREVGTDGFDHDADSPSDEISSPGRGEAHDDTPTTYHDTAQSSEGDDFEEASRAYEEGRSPTEEPDEDPVDLSASLRDDNAPSDSDISREASTDFDDLTAGDTTGYRDQLYDKVELSASYLRGMQEVLKYFNGTLRPAFGFQDL